MLIGQLPSIEEATDPASVAAMLYHNLMRSLGRQRWFAAVAARLAPWDARVLRRTHGRFGLLGNYGLPQCLLTTTGRKSGQPRTVTLLYGQRGDDFLLVGSNFGQSNHPAWALNLVDQPSAVLTITGQELPVTARLVTDPAEREEIWELMYQLWPAYLAYRGRAGREIKLFLLNPDADQREAHQHEEPPQ